MFKIGLVPLLAAVVAAGAGDGKEFMDDAYIKLSRKAKSDKIWAKIIEDSKPGDWHLKGALIVDQKPVFDTKGDEFECSSKD